MKLIREYFIQEVTYKYENETEKEMHKKHMISAGFSVAYNQPIRDISLVVTYQKRQLNDGIPRL